MSVSASQSVTVNAPLADVLAAVRDIANQPEWWPGMISATVLDTDDQGRATRAEIVNDVKIVKDQFEVDYQHTDTSMSWSLVGTSRAQKRQDGSWTLADKGAATEATLSLTIDTSLPLPGLVQRKIVGDQVKGAAKGLKAHLEG